MYSKLLEIAQQVCDQVMDARVYAEPAGSVARPRLVAHREAWDLSSTCRENTLAAFQRAQALGCWAIEFDVHFTQDDMPVVLHDASLWRTHRREALIRELAHASLKDLEPPVPILEQVVALRGLHFMIEIKTRLSANHMAILAQALRHLEPVRDYHLLVLDSHLVRVSSALPPEAWILVGEVQPAAVVDHSLRHRLGGVSGHYLTLTQRHIDRLRSAGQKAGVGFIPSRNLYRREWARGVDWVFTNRLADLV